MNTMKPIEIVILAILIWNAIVFLLYGLDKNKAIHNRRRISEKTLLLTAALLGAVGALVGMYTFRHKTKHKKFVIGVPLLLVLNIAAILAVASLIYQS